MPRTIDSIVANHHEASRRRNAGLPVWDHSVSIKHLLSSESRPASEIKALGATLAEAIRRQVPREWLTLGVDEDDPENTNFDFMLDEIVDAFEGLDEQDDPEEGLFVLDEFNGWLDEFYDWADRRRVWVR